MGREEKTGRTNMGLYLAVSVRALPPCRYSDQQQCYVLDCQTCEIDDGPEGEIENVNIARPI